MVEKIKSHRKALIATFVFFILTSLYTWPLVLRFSTAVFGVWGGRYGGDMFSSIYSYWLSKYLINNHLPLDQNSLVAYPFGVRGTHVFGLRTPGEIYTGIVITSLVNEIFAYNFFIFISFVLSGVFTFILVDYLFKNFWAALIAGVIFSFSPYHLYCAAGWAELSQMYWIPLYFYCLLKTEETKKYFWGVICGVVLFLTGCFVLYYGYFLAMMSAIYLGYKFMLTIRSQKKLDRGFKGLLLGLSLGGILMAGVYYKTVSNGKLLQDVYDTYTLRDLMFRSARVGDFLIPSVEHPIWGNLARKALKFFYPTYTHDVFDIFLGYTPLLLTLYGIRCFFKTRKKLSGFLQFSTLFFIIVLVSAFFLSLPPIIKIGPLKIPFISHLFYFLFPMFRSVSRYGVVIISAVSVLAAFGVTKLLENRENFGRYLVATGCLGLIFLEFQNKDTRVVKTYEVPAVYEWLREQPGQFAIAEYPTIFPDLDYRNMYYKFFQRIYAHPMLNGAMAGTMEDNLRLGVIDLQNQGVPKVLSSLGLKYVIVHEEFYRQADISGIISLPPEEIEGLKLVKKFGNDRVYEVTAQKQKVVALPHQLLVPYLKDKNGVWWYWLIKNSNINLYNSTTESISVKIKFNVQASTAGQVLNLNFNGKILSRKEVPLNKNIEVNINEALKPGSNILGFVSEGPPIQLKTQDGGSVEATFLIGNISIDVPK